MDLRKYEGCVGVDIGGQTIKIGGVANGELVSRDVETPAEYAVAREQILTLARELVGGRPRGLGVGSPGPLDWRTGIMAWTPNIPWREVNYAELGSALGCPAHIDNDANVAGLAEAVLGAGRGHRVVSGFTLGTGIGFFAVMDGRVYHGRMDVEGGHQVLDPEGPLCGCGARGCLEAYASASAILDRTGKQPEEIDDPAFWEEIAGYLARGVATINVLLCPDAVILAGGMTKRGEALFAPLRRKVIELCKILPAPPILPAELGARAGLFGALVLARQGHAV